MELGGEQIEHAKNAEVDVLDGALNKLRNILHGFLDRLNGAGLEIFGRYVVRLHIPPRTDTEVSHAG